MGRLTEAICFYNMKELPTAAYLRAHFTHFVPGLEDYKARERYQKCLADRQSGRRKKVMKDLFDDG